MTRSDETRADRTSRQVINGRQNTCSGRRPSVSRQHRQDGQKTGRTTCWQVTWADYRVRKDTLPGRVLMKSGQYIGRQNTERRNTKTGRQRELMQSAGNHRVTEAGRLDSGHIGKTNSRAELKTAIGTPWQRVQGRHIIHGRTGVHFLMGKSY